MEANTVKIELERLYSLIPEKVKSDREPPFNLAIEKPIDFLRTLYDYVDYIKNNQLIQKIITVDKEKKAQELIRLAKSSVESRHAHEHFEMFEEAVAEEKEEDVQDEIYNYGLLLDSYESFEKIKDFKTEEEMRKAYIVLNRESPYGKSSSKFYGYGIFNLAMFRYPEPKHLHFFLLNQLNELASGKPLNKHLEYDNEKGILHFNDKEIKIRLKNSPTVGAHLLLNYLINNKPFEKHSYYEFNDADVFPDEKSAKACWHICNDIQAKVLNETGIPDFLDYNTGEDLYLRVNPKYSLSIKDK